MSNRNYKFYLLKLNGYDKEYINTLMWREDGFCNTKVPIIGLCFDEDEVMTEFLTGARIVKNITEESIPCLSYSDAIEASYRDLIYVSNLNKDAKDAIKNGINDDPLVNFKNELEEILKLNIKNFNRCVQYKRNR